MGRRNVAGAGQRGFGIGQNRQKGSHQGLSSDLSILSVSTAVSSTVPVAVSVSVPSSLPLSRPSTDPWLNLDLLVLRFTGDTGSGDKEYVWNEYA
jgi:hypothetical protein